MRTFSEYSHGEQIAVLDNCRASLLRQLDELRRKNDSIDLDLAVLVESINREGCRVAGRILRRARKSRRIIKMESEVWARKIN